MTLIAALAALVLAPSAHAASYPGEHPAAASSLVWQMVAVGESYWRAHGVQPCATPTILLADNLGDPAVPDLSVYVSGRALLGGCTIWLVNADIKYDAQHPRAPAIFAATDCTVVAHELGHTAGLEHAAAGLMAVDPDFKLRECVRWARARLAHALRKRR